MNLAANAGGCGYGQAHRQLDKQADRSKHRANSLLLRAANQIDRHSVGARPHTGATDDVGSARDRLPAGLSTACGCPRLARPLAHGVANPRLHGQSDRCGHSGCRSCRVRNPGCHFHADGFSDSPHPTNGKHAARESDAGAQCSTFDRPCLLWPQPIPGRLEFNLDDHAGRNSDLDRSGDDPVSSPTCSPSTDFEVNRNTDSNCVADANHDTIVHALTVADCNTDPCLAHSYPDTGRGPFAAGLEAGPKSDYATLKGGTRALRTAVYKSCSLRTPTRLAAGRRDDSGGTKFARIGRTRHTERAARGPIDHDRGAHTARPFGATHHIDDRARYAAVNSRGFDFAGGRVNDGTRDSGP